LNSVGHILGVLNEFFNVFLGFFSFSFFNLVFDLVNGIIYFWVNLDILLVLGLKGGVLDVFNDFIDLSIFGGINSLVKVLGFLFNQSFGLLGNVFLVFNDFFGLFDLFNGLFLVVGLQGVFSLFDLFFNFSV
jgi:hypothetical protein